jgi:hypothetical protein
MGHARSVAAACLLRMGGRHAAATIATDAIRSAKPLRPLTPIKPLLMSNRPCRTELTTFTDS